MSVYQIVRMYCPSLEANYEDENGNALPTGLTLEEAQEHCNDPATRLDGVWFDGYTEQDQPRTGDKA